MCQRYSSLFIPDDMALFLFEKRGVCLRSSLLCECGMCYSESTCSIQYKCFEQCISHSKN